jgi:hypothetical protein
VPKLQKQDLKREHAIQAELQRAGVDFSLHEVITLAREWSADCAIVPVDRVLAVLDPTGNGHDDDEPGCEAPGAQFDAFGGGYEGTDQYDNEEGQDDEDLAWRVDALRLEESPQRSAGAQQALARSPLQPVNAARAPSRPPSARYHEPLPRPPTAGDKLRPVGEPGALYSANAGAQQAGKAPAYS